MFDSHIHLDQFSESDIHLLLQSSELQGVLAVATDLASAERLLRIKRQYRQVHIAGGFHPEQPLPTENQQSALFEWIAKNHHELAACGEVGLPHYLKREDPQLDYTPYLMLLERFILISKQYDLPLNLHIVYEDTDLALDLLAKHDIKKAHFHWFKADEPQLERLLATPYFVSVTPDILHNPKTQRIAHRFPLSRLLIETDAPWQHAGFKPVEIVAQLSAVIEKLAEIKKQPTSVVQAHLTENISACYAI